MMGHPHGRPYFTRWHRAGLGAIEQRQDPPRWFLARISSEVRMSLSQGRVVSRFGSHIRSGRDREQVR